MSMISLLPLFLCHSDGLMDVNPMLQAPALFLFAFAQVALHVAAMLAARKVFGFSLRETLLASNANVGGDTAIVTCHISVVVQLIVHQQQ